MKSYSSLIRAQMKILAFSFVSTILLLISLPGCSATPDSLDLGFNFEQQNCSLSHSYIQPAELTYSTDESHPRGVFLIVPGLNTRAKAMGSLAEAIAKSGYHALILSLRGISSGAVDDHKQVTATSWLKDLSVAYCYVRNNYPNIPVYYLGYSMGALLVTVFLDKAKSIKNTKLIFIAPAMGLRCKSYLLQPFTWLKYLNISVPSLAPNEYRARASTSFAAYDAFYNLHARSQEISNPSLKVTSALLFVDKRDELISPAKLNRWLRKNQLNSWHIKYISSSDKSDLPYHLMIDEKSLGKKNWTTLLKEINAQLEK